MKSIVVVAYYHIIHAMALALTFEEKPNLFVCVDYTRMNDEVLDNLRDTNAFNNVVKLNSRDFLDDFIPEIGKTKDFDDDEIRRTGSSIFDDVIDSYYYPKFVEAGADFDDTVYIYTEYHLIMYSLYKHFKRMTLCEDGYKVMNKRLETFKLKGYFRFLPPFIDAGYYPKMQFECEKIEELICSGDYEELPPELYDKVRLWDLRDIINENRERYKDVITTAFPIKDVDVSENTALLIEQPLYRTHFCSDLRYFLFYKKLIRELSKDQNVAIKPHPGGIKNLEMFENDRVKVIPKWVPVEAFNYADISFDSAITFYSAALDLLVNIKDHKAMYTEKSHDPSSIRSYISEYTKNEVFDIGVYVYYTDIKDDEYRKFIHYFRKNKKYQFNVYLMCPEDVIEKAEMLRARIRKKTNKDIEIICVEEFDQDEIFSHMLPNGSRHDYSIAISGNNRAKDVKRVLKLSARGAMGHCIGIHERCGNTGTICNPLEDHVLTGIVDVMFCRNLMESFARDGVGKASQAIEYVYRNRITTSVINGETFTTNAECRSDIERFADDIADDELSGLLRGYARILEFIFKRKDNGKQVDEKEIAAIYNDEEGPERGYILRAMIDSFYKEHQLRFVANKKINVYLYDEDVERLLEIRRIYRKIKKKIRKKIRRLTRPIRRYRKEKEEKEQRIKKEQGKE